MNRIGFMQGRLTEKGGFFPQTFPRDTWKDEFNKAQQMGLSYIEWMFNFDNWKDNPIATEEGIKEILYTMESTGVIVSSICANYYMKESIFCANDSVLNMLIDSAGKIKCRNVIVPLFEASDIERCEGDAFKKLEEVIRGISTNNVNILLETDFFMSQIAEFCNRFSKGVGVCYDIGNAIGNDKDVISEIRKYVSIIKNIHLKDKKIGGSTIMLGTGDAPFKECFKQLAELNYEGYYILESYYDSAIRDTKQNYEYIKEILK